MTGEVYLRYDVYMQQGGIFHNLFDIATRVETAIRLGLACNGWRRLLPQHIATLASPRTHGVQQRITLAFQPPSVVVRQVPVKLVHLVCRHDVEHPLDILHREEMTRHIEVAASPCKARVVDDRTFWKRHLRVAHIPNVRRQHLHQRLEPIEKPRLAVGRHTYARRTYLKHIALVAEGIIDRVVDCEHNGVSLFAP